MTALALLRHLTSPRILGEVALDDAAAWRALATWLSNPPIAFRAEPTGLDEWLARWSGALDVRGALWADAYLAAVAAAGGSRLVEFDTEFRRYTGIEFLHLRGCKREIVPAPPEHVARQYGPFRLDRRCLIPAGDLPGATSPSGKEKFAGFSPSTKAKMRSAMETSPLLRGWIGCPTSTLKTNVWKD